MVAFHNKRKHLHKTEKSLKDHNDLLAASKEKIYTKTNQLKQIMDDYSEAVLDFNFAKVSDQGILSNNHNNNTNKSSSQNRTSSSNDTNNNNNINIMDDFSQNSFELQPLLANDNDIFINTVDDFNSTVSVDLYDTAFSPTVFLTDATTAAASAANNRGLLMDTLLGSVMTTATATVTASSSASSSLPLSSAILSSPAGLVSAASATSITSLNGLQENLYETTVVAAVNSIKASANESAYWELETADSDFLYRHSGTMTIVYCIAYVIVFVVGLVGNSFVIAVVLRMRNMRTVTNYFIVNLAIADILVIVFCLPATLMSNIFVRKY